MCQKTVSLWFGSVALVFLCLLAAMPALCDSAAVDLIGRKGKVQVIERDGTVENVDPSALQLNSVRGKNTGNPGPKAVTSPKESDNQSADDASKDADSQGGEKILKEGGEVVGNAVEPGKTDGKAVGEEATTEPGKDAKGKLSKDAKAVTVPKEKKLTPEQVAARKKDAESVRKMLEQGGAYFYKADNTPLSYEEVKKMVESNNVEGIKALDLWQRSWESNDLAGKKTATTSNSAVQETKPPENPDFPEPKKKPERDPFTGKYKETN